MQQLVNCTLFAFVTIKKKGFYVYLCYMVHKQRDEERHFLEQKYIFLNDCLCQNHFCSKHLAHIAHMWWHTALFMVSQENWISET